MKHEIIHLDTVDSTNKFALELIEKGQARSGQVVIADEQTEGRGYADNKWISAKGQNLTFSLIIKPEGITPSNQFLITQVISLALQNELSAVSGSKEFFIKWPNDIYSRDSKIAGVLVQNVIKGSEIAFSVIGIGLNVNQQVFDMSIPNPVSLSMVAGCIFDLENLLDRLLLSIDSYFSKLFSSDNLDYINDEYLFRLYKANKLSTYKAADKIFKAKIKGLGPFGQLILKPEEGNEIMFGFKEVELML